MSELKRLFSIFQRQVLSNPSFTSKSSANSCTAFNLLSSLAVGSINRLTNDRYVFICCIGSGGVAAGWFVVDVILIYLLWMGKEGV